MSKQHFKSVLEPREHLSVSGRDAARSNGIACDLFCYTRWQVALSLQDTVRLRDALSEIIDEHAAK